MSIEKLPSGKFRAVVSHGGKKSRSKAVSTRAQAKILEAQLTLSVGAKPKDGGHTVAEVIAGFIADGETTMSPGTLDFYRKGEGAMPATFKSRQVSDVSAYILDGVYAEMRQGGASEHKIGKAHKLLSVSFARAARYGWVTANPCRDAVKPKPATKDIDPPSPEKVRQVITSAEDVNADLPTFLRLLAATGMRRGEGVALQWGDFEDGLVWIRRNLVEERRELTVRETKTGSKGKRRISVDEGTMEAIEALRLRQALTAAENDLPGPVWVFSHDAGVTPWTPSYTTRAFGRLSDEFTLHDLRHFHATQLLAEGKPIANVSRRLGHSSVTVTLNTYSHWLPEQDRDAADFIGDLLNGR
ncbi:MAG TPA: hypothetical protein DEG43_00575 [Acidimicrobiaceae bacterium]|nr:hypothetical protein [Acidimicrobiaceae bacterium]